MNLRAITAGILLVTLAGCSSEPPPPPPERDRALEHAVQEPLQRAQQLEEDMRKARAEQDERLREEGG